MDYSPTRYKENMWFVVNLIGNSNSFGLFSPFCATNEQSILLFNYPDSFSIFPQAPKKAKRRQQQGEGGSSNVFSMFEQSQIQEYKEVNCSFSHCFHFKSIAEVLFEVFWERGCFITLIWLNVSFDLRGNVRGAAMTRSEWHRDRIVNQVFFRCQQLPHSQFISFNLHRDARCATPQECPPAAGGQPCSWMKGKGTQG